MTAAGEKVLGVIVCDFEKSAIGTRSRLLDAWPAGAAGGAPGGGGATVIEEVVRRLAEAEGIGELALVVIGGDGGEAVRRMVQPGAAKCPVQVHAGPRRAKAMDDRVRIGRAWNLLSWRGGAGQWTVFDEEYHAAAIAAAMAASFGGASGGGGAGADHVFLAHSHGVLLDPAMAGMLVDHHLHKNHQTPFSFAPAAPGLCGMMFSAEPVRKMTEHQMLPHQWLEYNPQAPTFDTLIREACMQVDPALSKIPNRFCVDAHRGWEACKQSAAGNWQNLAQMCVAAGRGPAPGVGDLSRAFAFPREVEIELTGRRLTEPPGAVPLAVREGRGALDAHQWIRWLERQEDLVRGCDDLLLTIGGDGDPLLFGDRHGGAGDLLAILRAARACGVLSICVQTDLAGGDVEGLLAAAGEGLVDVVSVTFYGQTAATYAKVAGADLHGAVIGNMGRLAEATRARGGVPLVVPRLLKVAETIGGAVGCPACRGAGIDPRRAADREICRHCGGSGTQSEMEAFFDFWLERCGWAVIEGPTDRAGAVPFAAVVDMAPPKRKPCRRLWNRMSIRSDGRLAACDQDIDGKLVGGHIEKMGILEMWQHVGELRNKHAAEAWERLSPCAQCREWHRP